MIFTQSFIIVKFFNPKKSIFRRPAFSTTLLSNCVTMRSESLELVIGIKLINGSGVIIIPQAWVPTFLTDPSSLIALFIVSACKSSPLEKSINFFAFDNWSFLTFFFKSLSEKLKILSSDIRSGTSLAILSASNNGKSNTLAVSLMEDFAAIVPKVIIWATFFLPYFSTTQSITLDLPSSSKSISISGREILSGFKKRSKSKSYFIGSTFVILVQYATTEPAAEPLPGPTETFIFLACAIKSCTIKK